MTKLCSVLLGVQPSYCYCTVFRCLAISRKPVVVLSFFLRLSIPLNLVIKISQKIKGHTDLKLGIYLDLNIKTALKQ